MNRTDSEFERSKKDPTMPEQPVIKGSDKDFNSGKKPAGPPGMIDAGIHGNPNDPGEKHRTDFNRHK